MRITLGLLAGAAMLAPAAAGRQLLQGGGGAAGSTMTTGPGGGIIGVGGAAGSLMTQMMQALNAGELMEFLVFDQLKSAFLVQVRHARHDAHRVHCRRCCLLTRSTAGVHHCD